MRGTLTLRYRPARPATAVTPSSAALEQFADGDRRHPVLGVLVRYHVVHRSASVAAISRRRNSGSLKTRLMRARALRCAPVDDSGATSTKNR